MVAVAGGERLVPSSRGAEHGGSVVVLVCTAMHASMPVSLSARAQPVCVRASEDTYETGHGTPGWLLAEEIQCAV